MDEIPSRQLVIDACIAQAAGDANATAQTSIDCRNALAKIRDVGHKVVFSDAIREEWFKPRENRPQSPRLSRYASAWLQEMTSRTRIVDIDLPPDDSFRRRIEDASPTREITAILHKDCHLIEAALATNKIVISIETRCRYHFCSIAPAVAELPQIGWVNPADPTEKAVEWLESGAKIADCRRLAPIISPR